MILVIDNYDSFTYNLVQYLGQCGAEVKVWRNDEITLDEVMSLRPDGILLSPGPCTPKESGVCLDIAKAALTGGFPPIFGVCLGYQAIGLAAGANVRGAKTMMHGKASQIQHDGKRAFAGIPNPFSAIRYHSLVLDNLPAEFEASAHSLDDHEIMAMRHRHLPIEGVLFHPESILTESGLQIVQNFANQVKRTQPIPVA